MYYYRFQSISQKFKVELAYYYRLDFMYDIFEQKNVRKHAQSRMRMQMHRESRDLTSRFLPDVHAIRQYT